MTGTRMWGERGLVATYFLDVAADTSLARWKQFFQSVQFVTRNGLDWDRLARVWAVVEPSFGVKGFGLPDLAVRAEFEDGIAVGVFLEAKTGIYAECTLAPSGRGLKKFNSSLNGQLELNHRLTLALQAYNCTGSLSEPRWVTNTPYLGSGAPRYVRRTSVLRRLVPELCGPRFQRYLHIAVTSDGENPLTGQQGGYLPQIFRDLESRDFWPDECDRFGWVNWATLKTQANSWTNSLFLDSYALNEDYLLKDVGSPRPGTPPIAWPSNRPQVGVSLVFLPTFDVDTRDTAVHLSWSGGTCAIRNFCRPGRQTDPSSPTYLNTLEILPLVVKERRFGRSRPRVIDTSGWLSLIDGTNAQWGLPRCVNLAED